MALVLAWPLVTFGFIVSGRAWLPLGYIVIGALGLRLDELRGYGGSDVLDAVTEGIGVLLAGLVQLPAWRVAAVGAVLVAVSAGGFAIAIVSLADTYQAEGCPSRTPPTAP